MGPHILSFDPRSPYENEHAARLRDSADFKEKPWARVKRKATKFNGRGYFVLRGRLKSNDEWTDQGLRYPVETWPEADARKHAKDHDATSFEPAKKSEDKDMNNENRTWYSLSKAEPKAEGEQVTLEVDMFDMIGYYGIKAEQFINDIKAAGEFAALRLNINSPGGSVLEGNSIYNFLLGLDAKVTAHVDFAASMASVIAMSAARIEIAENGFMMIHNAWTCICGDAEELRKEADLLDQIKENIIRAYARHTDLTHDEVAKLMDDETWMNAPEAFERGFADEITDVSDKAAASLKLDLSTVSKLPAALRPAALLPAAPAALLPAVPAAPVPEPEPEDTNGVQSQGKDKGTAPPPKPPAVAPPTTEPAPARNPDDAAYDEGKLAGENLGYQKARAENIEELNGAALKVAELKHENEEQARISSELLTARDGEIKRLVGTISEKDTLIENQNKQLSSVRAGFVVSDGEGDAPTTWAEAMVYFTDQGKSHDDAHVAAREQFPELFEQMKKDGNSDTEKTENT